MKKYLFSILTLLLLFPIMVGAEGNEAKIGETEYATVEEAITAATDGATITLLGNTNDITVTEGKKVTIDLGGFAITEFVNNGEVTLKNGDINFDFYDRAIKNTGVMVLDGIDLVGHDSTSYAVNNNGTMTIKNTTFAPVEGEYAQFLYNAEGATATIESGTYLAHDMFKNYGKFVVSGGTFTITSNTVANYNYNEMEVLGGTFNAERNTNIVNIRGSLVIRDGKFTGLNGVENYDPSYVNNNGEYVSDIIILGGEFDVTGLVFSNASFSNYARIQVDGGVFKSSTTDYVIGDYGTEHNSITIKRGTITANSSKGIFLNGDSELNIGIAEFEEVTSDDPVIDIRNGFIQNLGNVKVNFYDGVLNVKGEYIVNSSIATVTTPKKYSIKYDKNEDNSYKAYLVKEVDKYWEKFVEAFKKSEIVISAVNMAEYVLPGSSSIVHTDDSLIITLPVDKNNVHVTKFTYDSETGIIKYVPMLEINPNNASIDNGFIIATLEAISVVKGYDIDKVLELVEILENPTIEKDGITFKLENFLYENGNISTNVEYYSIYELDIVNGLKLFNNTSKPITNPSTGISFPIIFVLIALVFGFGVYLIRNKKYFSRG